MNLSQFFNLGITTQQAKLGMEKLMQCGVALPQNILDAYKMMNEQKKAIIIAKSRARAKKWLKKIKAKNIKNAKNGQEFL